jgi:hypothetical protein
MGVDYVVREAYAKLSDAAEARRSDLWFPRSLILKAEGFA